MIIGSLARRYARALMAIGTENNTYERLGAEVGALAQAMSVSPELAETLANPAFPRSDRRRVLAALLDRLGAGDVVKRFVMFLLEQDRLAALPDIVRELTAMIDDKAGRVNALVTAATELDESQTRALRAVLANVSAKTVTMQVRRDPELLGGVVAKLGDIVYDGSLRTQLELLKRELAS